MTPTYSSSGGSTTAQRRLFATRSKPPAQTKGCVRPPVRLPPLEFGLLATLYLYSIKNLVLGQIECLRPPPTPAPPTDPPRIPADQPRRTPARSPPQTSASDTAHIHQTRKPKFKEPTGTPSTYTCLHPPPLRTREVRHSATVAVVWSPSARCEYRPQATRVFHLYIHIFEQGRGARWLPSVGRGCGGAGPAKLGCVSHHVCIKRASRRDACIRRATTIAARGLLYR